MAEVVEKPEVSAEDAAVAEELKNDGNAFFKSKSYTHAIMKYSEAIDISPLPAYLCNRAFAHIKNDCAGSAILDADASIAADPSFIKAYYRRATAKVMLGKWKEANKDYRRVTQLKPGDADAAKKYKECDKEVKRQAFLQAIKTEEREPLASKFAEDWKHISVPSSYKGPLIDAESPVPITETYVEQLRDLLKDQKMPPKRDVYGLLVLARQCFERFPNVVPVKVEEGNKINICGDVHGQYYDLLHLFEVWQRRERGFFQVHRGLNRRTHTHSAAESPDPPTLTSSTVTSWTGEATLLSASCSSSPTR